MPVHRRLFTQVVVPGVGIFAVLGQKRIEVAHQRADEAKRPIPLQNCLDQSKSEHEKGPSGKNAEETRKDNFNGVLKEKTEFNRMQPETSSTGVTSRRHYRHHSPTMGRTLLSYSGATSSQSGALHESPEDQPPPEPPPESLQTHPGRRPGGIDEHCAAGAGFLVVSELRL